MNKFVMLLVTLMVTLFGANAFAFTPPDAPAKGWYVVDKAGKLSQSQINRLNQKIEQVSQTTKNEFGILVLDTMDGATIEDVAYDTFKKWGVGKHGLDNGVLIVISVKERKSRIETGKGVGGDVPDLRAKDILDKNLAPHLKKGDFYGGLDETLSALSSLIESRHNEKATPRSTPASAPVGVTPSTSNGGCSAVPVGTSSDTGFSVMVLALGLIFLGGWLMARRARNKEREAAEARAREAHNRQVRLQAQRKLQEELEAAARERDRILNLPTPPVSVPVVRTAPPVVAPRPYTPPVKKVTVPRPTPKTESRPTYTPPVVSNETAIAAAAAATALRLRQEAEEERQAEARREARRREEREEEERRARARREEEERYEARRREEEEDRRRRDEESRSSYSSYDYGSSSSDSDSGSGFGGGDSGGGGSSSDW